MLQKGCIAKKENKHRRYSQPLGPCNLSPLAPPLLRPTIKSFARQGEPNLLEYRQSWLISRKEGFARPLFRTRRERERVISDSPQSIRR